jgi:hypothetical protein
MKKGGLLWLKLPAFYAGYRAGTWGEFPGKTQQLLIDVNVTNIRL